VQTTTIDPEADLIPLGTVLARIRWGILGFSDWPVCPISNTGSSQRMGTVLTYAPFGNPQQYYRLKGESGLGVEVLPDLFRHLGSAIAREKVVTTFQGHPFLRAVGRFRDRTDNPSVNVKGLAMT
jgi:hypothetical protein